MESRVAEEQKSSKDHSVPARQGGKPKVIVAVHGIGDQTSFATIQSTLFQFCRFYGAPAAVPLGSFHSGQAWLQLTSPPFPETLNHLAFAEVYWANIPRDNANKKTLEESQNWARTIVERVRQRNQRAKKSVQARASEVQRTPGGSAEQKGTGEGVVSEGHMRQQNGASSLLQEEDFPMLEQVMREMLQTLGVLDRLCFLANKAGVFTFDLNQVMVDYLADVQVVTEFKTLRRQILDEFDKVMQKVYEARKDAEIYIVAHSEGTVVAFLGLLEAMCSEKTPEWVKKVRGFMTIGSPIDKHLILWPELFDSYKKPRWEPNEKGENGEKPIEWRNYYDHGDPVGFNLDSIRLWLQGKWKGFEHKWSAFDFKDEFDYGFSRYPLPGKAHNDYWADDEVFGHFIQNVVGETPPTPAGRKPPDYSKAPRNKSWMRVLSWVTPYVIATVLLFVAVFVLNKAIDGYLNPPPDVAAVRSAEAAGNQSQTPVVKGTAQVFKNVFALTLLLAGLTVVTRIPRLTRGWGWRIFGVLFFAASAVGYWFMTDNRNSLVVIFAMAIAFLVLAIYCVYVIKNGFPPVGIKLLLALGTLGIAAIVINHIRENSVDPGPLWPVLLATVAFLYLWWLVALLFDLSFIWHRYIRTSEVMNCLRDVCKLEHHGTASQSRAKTGLASSA